MSVMFVWNSKLESNLNKYLREDAHKGSSTKGKEGFVPVGRAVVVKKVAARQVQLSLSPHNCDFSARNHVSLSV
jgi:hypothetical protein